MKQNLILLNEAAIHDALKQLHFTSPYQLHCLTEIDSTNRFLQSLPMDAMIKRSIDFCCAETQTAGRGRFQRQWHSPFGENIYFSGRWRFNKNLPQLSCLNLVVSLAILKTIQPYAPNKAILIKWPNDLLWNHQKLCGILSEVSTHQENVIIGMGLNVNSSNTRASPIDQAWCSLLDMTGHATNRNELLAKLIVTLDQHLNVFFELGFEPFAKEWDSVDYLKNQWISVTQSKQTLCGFARGITAEGLLRLENDQLQIINISAGDASLAIKK
jgi:BirA family biotin operon repressor/biotin-[acetyl-CoA-carboxylase] ligase